MSIWRDVPCTKENRDLALGFVTWDFLSMIFLKKIEISVLVGFVQHDLGTGGGDTLYKEICWYITLLERYLLQFMLMWYV